MAPNSSAFFHGRNELVRDDPASDLVDEFETATPLERFHTQIHFAELPRPAGLLLVTMVTLGGLAYGLAVGDLRWARTHLDVVTLGHLLQHHAQMQVAEPANHRFVQ